MVILVTGKKGCGKSHFCKKYSEELKNEDYLVKWIDWNQYRKDTGNNDYSDKGRLRNLISASKLASEYEKMGYIVLMSFMMPKKKWRNRMRTYFIESKIIYIPGGTIWENSVYERPSEREMRTRYNYR